jgi:hypothetical protein
MRTVFALGLAVSFAALGAGCSTPTQVKQIGPDTFTVSAHTPRGGTSSARDAALSAANQQCARLSKQLLVLKSSSDIELKENQVTETKDIVSDIMDVTFRCLAAGDPALGRH